MNKKQHIRLRAPELSDIDLLFEWENDQDLWYLSNTKLPFSRFDLEQYVLGSEKDIYSSKQARFMIDANMEDQSSTVGCIDIFDFDPANHRAGIGIMIASAHRNKGFASAALDEVIDFSFKVLHLHQLYCNIAENNQASLKLFQRKAFLVAGLKKDWIFVDGKWENEVMLQLINSK